MSLSSLDWKKLGLFAMIIGSAITFGFLIYFFFFRPFFVSTPSTDTDGQLTEGELPTAGTGGERPVIGTDGPLTEGEPLTPPVVEQTAIVSQVKQLTDKSIIDPVQTADGSIIYYQGDDDKFYRVTPSGDISPVSSKLFYDVQNISWSGDRNRAVLEYPDGSNIVHDFAANRSYTLPSHWQEFSFAPGNERIAFKSVGLDPENRFLAVSSINGAETKIIENMGDKVNNFQVNWSPNNSMVATFDEGVDAGRSEVYFVGLNKENFRSLPVNGYGFEGKWSPAGNQLLYNVYSSGTDYRPRLWITQAGPTDVGAARRQLYLETWSDKCTFAGDTRVICAVPTNLPFGAALDRTVAANLSDRIYDIDLTTGAQRLINTGATNYTVTQPMVSADGSTLYFTDNGDNRLYQIELK